MGKSSVNGPFSIAMLNNQRVYIYIQWYPSSKNWIIWILWIGRTWQNMCSCKGNPIQWFYHIVSSILSYELNSFVMTTHESMMTGIYSCIFKKNHQPQIPTETISSNIFQNHRWVPRFFLGNNNRYNSKTEDNWELPIRGWKTWEKRHEYRMGPPSDVCWFINHEIIPSN